MFRIAGESMESTTHEPVAISRAAPAERSPWLILAVVGIAQFMLIIDLTVLNVALPSIARELRLERASLTWIATAYTLFFGSLLLLGGRLADAIGRRVVFLAGLAVFAGASIMSGLAPDGLMLIAARIGQGIGAAMLSPAALSIVTTTFTGPSRVQALALWGALGGAGAVAGVILGGVLTEGPGWRWAFFINVPIAAVVGAAAFRIVAADRSRKVAGALDLPGAAAITATIGLALYGLIGAGESGWASTETLTVIGMSALAAIAFVVIERRTATPLLRLATLRRGYLSASLHILAVFAGLLGGATFLGSLYAQRALQMSPLETGVTFVPFAAAVIVGAQAGAHAIGRVGPRRVAALGLLLAAVGAALLSQLPPDGDVLTDVLPGFVLMALGLGATAVTANTAAFVGVGDVDAGVTSGLVNTSHELGIALGVSALSTIAGASLGADPTVVTGYQSAFTVASLAAAAVAIVAYRTLPASVPGGTRFGH
jgi:EmrB/QacA subfamily drug resistance transporter